MLNVPIIYVMTGTLTDGVYSRWTSLSLRICFTVNDDGFDRYTQVSIGGSRGGREGRTPPPGRPNSFDFMQFSGKFGVFTPPLEGSRPPSGKSWIRHWWTKYTLMVLTMADPGFSLGGRGANSQSGCTNLFFSPKTAWKWKNLNPDERVPGAPWIRQWLRKVRVPKRRVVGMGTLQQLLYALVDLVSLPTAFISGSKGVPAMCPRV